MNQLQILYNPNIDSKLVENLELPLQYNSNGSKYYINNAELLVYKGEELIANGKLETGENYQNGTLAFSQYPQIATSLHTYYFTSGTSIWFNEIIGFDSRQHLYVIELTTSILSRFDDIYLNGKINLDFSLVLGESLNDSTGIAFDSLDRIYIIQKTQNRIIRVDDMNGTNFIAFGTHGSGENQFNAPKSIFIDENDFIYISDTSNNRIVRINDMLGTGWISFGILGTEDRQFSSPNGIAVLNEYIYVVDQNNKRICKFKSMIGDEWETFGAPGTGEGQFFIPIKLVVMHDETIAVTQYNGTIVQMIVFNGMSGTGWTVYSEDIGYGITSDGKNRICNFSGNSLNVLDKNIIPETSTIHDKLVYSWTDSENTILSASPKSGYKALWILNNGDKRVVQWFSVNYWVLHSPIEEIDVITEKPDLETFRPTYRTGTTATIDSSGSFLICDNLLHATDYWNGAIVRFDSGDNTGKYHRVIDWTPPYFILEDPLENVAIKGDRFTLFRSFQMEIHSAWNEITDKLNSWVPAITSSGSLNLAIDQYDFRSLHLYQAVSKISSSLRMKKGDAFDLWREEYDEKIGIALNELRVKIDQDLDGIFEQNETSDDYIKGGIFWAQH